jgi:hypothetical protein
MLHALSAAVDDLAVLDVSTWSDAGIAEEFIAIRHAVDRLEAIAAQRLVAVHERRIALGEGASSTPRWAEWRTGQRARVAKASLDAGLACAHLPVMADAWAAGTISASVACSIGRGVKAGHEELYQSLEPLLVEFAVAHQFRDLDGVIRYYRRAADEIDDRAPQEKNGLYLSPVGDRYALNGDLDLLTGKTAEAAFAAAIDEPTPDDTRTHAQCTADAFARICESYLDRGDLPIEDGEAPHLSLVIPWDLVISGLPCKTALSDLNAALSKHEIARLLCDANISRIILGPDGQPLDVGRSQRTAPRWIRRAIAARDKGCRYPGCHRTPRRCEAHHVWAWENGGPTAIHNLVLLCSFHHHVIHRKGWTNTFDGITYTVKNQYGIKIE